MRWAALTTVLPLCFISIVPVAAEEKPLRLSVNVEAISDENVASSIKVIMQIQQKHCAISSIAFLKSCYGLITLHSSYRKIERCMAMDYALCTFLMASDFKNLLDLYDGYCRPGRFDRRLNFWFDEVLDGNADKDHFGDRFVSSVQAGFTSYANQIKSDR